MSLRSPKTPGPRRGRGASALLALALLPACMYGFTGGGLPTHIRTVFIEPWENTTPYNVLTSDVQQALQQGLPRSLGVRLAPRTTADAIVRGKLVTYDEQTTNINPNPTPGGRVEPLQSQVRITFEAEIYDVKNDSVLWRGAGLSALGNFAPGNVDEGRRKAIDEVVQKLVQGAQSQW
ncbi:MAG TPA: LPS assembly lipoprotein LptE [Longimicrobiaceae bacterium]|nr:LPS assembly lipoprotein LptE [Longimicrobiaceae bacterium]